MRSIRPRAIRDDQLRGARAAGARCPPTRPGEPPRERRGGRGGRGSERPRPARALPGGSVPARQGDDLSASARGVLSDPRELEREIRITVLHELAHYFGIEDRRLEELGYE